MFTAREGSNQSAFGKSQHNPVGKVKKLVTGSKKIKEDNLDENEDRPHSISGNIAKKKKQ